MSQLRERCTLRGIKLCKLVRRLDVFKGVVLATVLAADSTATRSTKGGVTSNLTATSAHRVNRTVVPALTVNSTVTGDTKGNVILNFTRASTDCVSRSSLDTAQDCRGPRTISVTGNLKALGSIPSFLCIVASMGTGVTSGYGHI